ncbi:uncharacterized protein C9orf152-like [Parambassis ranga]|uniref:Uncharacterized protein C9orf152-like n=1 Tax=Parambassis ranga TaxID=210632 RepID=A0A6P7KGK0_9TELE|nr:uncharacterized protein C9orf152 homolog [Parambassis ranga]
MSCSWSCCCPGASGRPQLPDEIRKKEQLVGWEEEEKEEEELCKRKMDISVLREQYRNSRETQRRHTQVLLFRTVSEELSEAVSIVPVAQVFPSPLEPSSTPPLPATAERDLATYDPWHVHLDLHRRSSSVQPPPPSSAGTGSRHSWSSSEAGGTQLESRGRAPSVDSVSALRGTSPCSSPSTTEEQRFRSTAVDQVQGQGADPPESPVCSSPGDPRDCSSDGSSTPVASITCSPSSSTTGHRSTAPGLRFTRQLSVGGTSPASQDYYPFPSRKTPRVSEAARRLGMYSSF